MRKNVRSLVARQVTRKPGKQPPLFRATRWIQTILFYACLVLATFLAFSVSSTSASARITAHQPGSQQSVLAATASTALTLVVPARQATGSNILSATLPGVGSHTPPVDVLIGGPLGYAGSCDAGLSLADANQLQNCYWYYDPGGGGDAVWTCDPGPSTQWTDRPDLVYLCVSSGGGDYYCAIPSDIAIEDLTSITCSDTETTTNGMAVIGPATDCTYDWSGTSTCTAATVCVATTNLDPVTGIPTNADPTNPCVVAVTTTCPAGTTSSADDWLFGTNGLLYAGGGAGLPDTGTNTKTQDNTTSIPLVQTIWAIIAGIALALLAIPLVLAGFQLMQGLGSENHAKAVELLGKVLLVALGVLVSWEIVTWLIQLEDALAQYVSNNLSVGATTIPMPSSNWKCYAQQFFGTLYNMNVDTTNNAANTGGDAATYAKNLTEATLTLIENLPNYILTLLSVLLAIQLVVRLALLNLYIIISPLAIFCAAMPGKIGTSVTSHWIKNFASLLSVQVVQLLMLVLVGIMLTGWLQATGVTSGSLLLTGTPAGYGSTQAYDWATTLFFKLIPIVVMVITLNVPRLFNSSATTLLSTVSSSIGGAMSGIALIIRGL